MTVIRHRNPSALLIQETLQKRILRGEYPAETWLPTERALADEFEVDRTVVRAALDLLEHAEMIVRMPGKRPWVRATNHAITSAPTSRQPHVEVRTIVAILPHEGHSASSMAVLQGINQALRLQYDEFSLKVEDNYGEDATFSSVLERRALENARAQNAAGVILWHMGCQRTRETINSFADEGVPIVLIDRIPEGIDCDFVGVDNIHSAQKAVNHLLGLGHRRIGHLTHKDSASTILDRKNGYNQALRLRGISEDESLICNINDFYGTGNTAADYYFNLESPPTAIFAVNDNLAHAFVSDVEKLGKQVPQDISVVGFDDVERFSHRPAILTTMSHPFDQVGQRAASLILQRIQGDGGKHSPRQHILLNTALVERKTTAALLQAVKNV